MQIKKYIKGAFLAFLLIGLLFSIACGGDSDSNEVANNAGLVPTVAAEKSEPSNGKSDSSNAKEKDSVTKLESDKSTDIEIGSGGIFRRLWAAPPTLDPHLTQDTTSAAIVVEIYSGLVTIDTDLQLVPDIAESWEISDDGKIYTFYLRSDARFHDGRYITASDFEYSINRAANPETASPTAATYLSDIVGVKEVLEGESTQVDGVKAIDDTTLQITIDAPKAYFLAKLTYPTAFVVDSSQVMANPNWTDKPNGSGPFKLKEYKIGERIILERFDEFYKEPAKLDQVHMNLAGGQAMAMYENDEIDITGLSIFDFERVKDSNDPLSKDWHIAPPGISVSYATVD